MRWSYLAVMVILCVAASSLSAADIVWQGGGANTDWATGGNWVGGTAPGAADRAIFNGSGAVSVTNASTVVGSIEVTGSAGQSVTIGVGAFLVITDTSSVSIRLFDGNSLTINGGSTGVTVESHIYVDNGTMTFTGSDTRLGSAVVPDNVSVRQHNGNISFGELTILAPSTMAAAQISNSINFRRTAGGTGTISMGSLFVQGDQGNVGPGGADNIARADFENVELTVTGNITLQSAQSMTATPVDGSGAQMYVEDSTVTYQGNIFVGDSGSAGPLEAPELGIQSSTFTNDSTSSSEIRVESEAVFTCVQSTLTSTSSAGNPWTLNCFSSCDTCVIVDSTVTAFQADRLAVLLSGTNSSFEFGLVVTGSTFSNYDGEGVRILSGSYLTAFNDNTFATGKTSGSHVKFLGALGSGALTTADGNQFDNSTVGTGDWVNNNGATVEFRALSGTDFETGAGSTNATQAAAKTTNTTGSVTWSDSGVGLQIALNGTSNGLTSTATANQVIALFGLTAVGGNIDIAAVSMEVEFDDEGGGFVPGTDIAALTLFVDSNSNGVYDVGTENGYATAATPTSGTNTWATIQTATPEQITSAATEQWGLAITFNSSITTKSARIELMLLPKIGSGGANPITMFSPFPTTQVSQIAGLPILADSIQVSGVSANGWVERPAGGAVDSSAFTTQPRLILVDANGNRSTHDSTTVVTASINSGSGTLGGTVTATAVNGVVTFTNLQVTGSGSHSLKYDFTGGTTINSSSFMVTTAPPEIDISRTVSIPDGTGSDDVGDQRPSFGPTVNYTIDNSGAGALAVTAINFSALSNCNPSINSGTSLPLNIASSANDTAGIDLNLPAGSGAFSFTIEFVNNDPDEASYTFTVSGNRVESALEIRDGATVMIDGQNTTVNGVTAGTAKTVTYTIANTGGAPLNIGTFDFSGMSNITGTPTISSAPGTPVSTGGGTTTFDITFTATAAGSFFFEFDLINDDPNYPAGGFNQGFQGTATAGAEPEIAISRNTAPIADAGTDAIAGDIVASVNTPFTYTIDNLGTADLTISSSSITGTPANCTANITTTPAATVAASGSTTFVLTVNATAAGAWSCVVTILNNDTDEATYNFTVSGNAATTAPEINIKRGATSIIAGGTDNVATTTLLIYTVENTGTATLTFTGSSVSISGQTGCTASISTALSNSTIPTVSTDSFAITVVPAGGAFSFDILVESDDADESNYVIHVTGSTIASGGGDSGDGGDDGGCAVSSSNSTMLWALLALLFAPAILRRRKRI